MKKYDFDKLTDRSKICSVKWNVGEGELPMWIADMDFEVCPDIVNAIQERIKLSPTFGYCYIPPEWYDAYIDWWKTRHGYTFKRESLMFSIGAVPSVSSIVRRLTHPAEKVLLQTPVYNMFFNSIVNNGRYVKQSPLIYNGNGYDIDFNALEKDLSDPQTTLMIVCNPHNPVGRIWSKDELKTIGELCYKHNVTVISDEIHCDIVKKGESYTPFAAASEICEKISVTCMAPSKAFNIAGIQTSAIYAPDEAIKNKIYRGINNDEVAEPNTFAVSAAVAALTKGGEWLGQMLDYVFENRRIADEFISKNIPPVKLVPALATYLLWVDISKVCADSVEFAAFLRKKTGLYVCDGAEYGEAGKSFLRINVACPRQRVLDGLNRLKRGVELYAVSKGK